MQPPTISPSVNRLSRQTQRVLSQLRSGHSSKLASYRARIGQSPSPLCHQLRLTYGQIQFVQPPFFLPLLLFLTLLSPPRLCSPSLPPSSASAPSSSSVISSSSLPLSSPNAAGCFDASFFFFLVYFSHSPIFF